MRSKGATVNSDPNNLRLQPDQRIVLRVARPQHPTPPRTFAAEYDPT